MAPALLAWLASTAAVAACASASAVSVSVSIDASAPIAETDERFLSFSFDTTALFGVQRAAIDFQSPVLQKLASNLAPAYL